MENNDTRTFKINPKIEMKKVRFKNRYGITLAGDLYLPEGYEGKRARQLLYPILLAQ